MPVKRFQVNLVDATRFARFTDDGTDAKDTARYDGAPLGIISELLMEHANRLVIKSDGKLDVFDAAKQVLADPRHRALAEAYHRGGAER